MSERVPDKDFKAASPQEKFSWMYAEAQRARAEVDALRRCIDSAPHDPHCDFDFQPTPEGPPLPCDCWKKDVPK